MVLSFSGEEQPIADFLRVDSGMGGEGLDGVFPHPNLLGIYGCRLKSSYILLERMTWEWGVGSQWEVWVKKHFVNCHHGDLKHLFLGELEKASC